MFRSALRFMRNTVTGAFALMASMLSLAGPTTIDYELTALASPGRYVYRYALTNVSLVTPLSWFSIDFDAAMYDESSLAITTTGLGDWSQQILGSVLANPAQFDSYNVLGKGLDIGDTLAGFTIEFIWLGAGSPGSQAFTIYDPANLNVLDSGFTTAAAPPPLPPELPEPSSVALVLLALGGAVAATRLFARRAGSSANSACLAPAAA